MYKLPCYYRIFFLLVLVINISACMFKPLAPAEQAWLIVTDDAGRVVRLNKKPERIIPLANSCVDLLYGAGGTAVGKPSSAVGNLPPAAQSLPEVGHFAAINVEQVIALQPDLIIGFQGMHERLAPVFASSNIPFILVRLKTYTDIKQKLYLFGELAGTQAQAAAMVKAMDDRINGLIERVPTTTKSVALLHATGTGVTIQLDNSIAGSIATLLRLKNIAADVVVSGNPDMIPYSMETLVAGDPDLVLISYMGNMSDIEQRLQAELRGNPAWSGLRAVQQGKVFFLPMELFLFNPGINFDVAVAYMAGIVYPESFAPIQ